MNQINFNDKRILKSLLDKSKTTTIRKAWEIEHNYSQDMNGNDVDTPWTFNKPCKYKEGETYEVVWKKDSGFEKFCCGCKKGFNPTNTIKAGFGTRCCGQLYFNKILGKVKITKIEKIEISNYSKMITRYTKEAQKLNDLGEEAYALTSDFTINLSKSEGFKNPEEMFKFLEEYSGRLETAKPFWLISFVWK